MTRKFNLQKTSGDHLVERLKEELHLLRMVLGIVLAADLSVMAWLGQSYPRMEAAMLPGVVVIIAFLTGGFIFMVYWIRSLLDKLEYCLWERGYFLGRLPYS